MPDLSLQALIYGAPVLLIVLFYLRGHRQRGALATATLEENQAAGMTEPPSLHPLIDAKRCIGCGSCVTACPEGGVLGLIDRKAHLVNPTHCIGHGACKAACPMGAISLVFGSEKRGVDIPMVTPRFETNVPGMFIAGELGGMGLIRNAVEQGRQAMESIRKLDGLGKGDGLDVIIVGAGPAGLSASLAAIQHKLRYVTLEQESLGGTVAHFPRGKLVMTAPVQLPLVGKVKFTEVSKETLLAFWEKVVEQHRPDIRFQERVETIKTTEQGFEVVTNRGSYRSRAVLLAIGRRGTPRKLEVEGEDRSKVVYRLIDAEQYRGKHVLIVGGGDSALEAATSVAEQPDTTVTLSYRSGAFSRAKEKNRQRVEEAEAAGRLRVLLNSNVQRVLDDHVEVEQEGQLHALPNDAMIVSAGGILPTGFLKSIGIEVETKHGTA